jgi:glyoxylase-like metal-dependent hydrolase (beta-lactamase superfamily II)
MRNFTYLIGDRGVGEALVVDPAYAVGDLLDALERDGMRCTGVLATHCHPDHLGGDLMGFEIEGLAQLLARVMVPVHVQREEAFLVEMVTGVGLDDMVAHSSGEVVMAGAVPVELVHTPGHTPGSQCLHVEGRLVTGDTLFLDGCGRTDLPGGDAGALYESITKRLARFGDDTLVYPGHRYSPEPSASLGATRRHNYVFKLSTPEQWMAMFGDS